MGLRKKGFRSKNNVSAYLEGVSRQMGIQRNKLQKLEETLKTDIERQCEFLISTLPQTVLNTKLKDLDSVCSYKSKEATVRENTKEIEGCSSNIGILPKPDHKAKNAYTPYERGIPKYVITPKVGPTSPQAVLRLPFKEEFAVSAAGSPLLVSSMGSDSASIIIPLKNGKVMSLLPVPGANTEVIEQNLEPSVRRQLETLQQCLTKIIVKSDS